MFSMQVMDDIDIEYLDDTAAAVQATAPADAAADTTAATLCLKTKTDLTNLFVAHNPAFLTIYESAKTFTNYERVQV